MKKRTFNFIVTVSSRGQIFIPKALQEYFGIKARDKVIFTLEDNGSILFKKIERSPKGHYSA